MKIKKLATTLLAGVVALSSLGFIGTTQKVEAGVFNSPGSSSGGGNGGGGTWYPGASNYTSGLQLTWTYGSGNKVVTIPGGMMRFIDYPYSDRNLNISGTKWAFLTMNDITFTGVFEGMNRDHYIIWPIIDRMNGRNGVRIDRQSKKLTGDWVTYLKQQGADINSNGERYIYRGQYVDAINMTAYKITKPAKTTTETKKTIVKIDGTTDKNFDNTNKGLEWNFNNTKTTAPYNGKSNDGQATYGNKISKKVYEIKKTVTYPAYSYMSDQRDPGYGAPKITYTKVREVDQSNTFKYKRQQPDPVCKFYAPYNLNKAVGNKTGAMTSAEDTNLIRSKMGDYKDPEGVMDIDPNNLLNVTDGSNLPMLDTNTPLKFTIKWNNSQFGLPEDKIKLNDERPADGWSMSPAVTGQWSASGSYNQGNTDLSGQKSNTQYYSGHLVAGTSSNKSSLQYNDAEEKVGPEVMNVSKPNKGQTDTWKTRTTSIGTYNFTNGDVPFMMLQYSAGLRYTYGIEYSGIVDVNGFNAPNSVETGLYTTDGSTTVRQPILWGQFEAKTVAGNAHN